MAKRSFATWTLDPALEHVAAVLRQQNRLEQEVCAAILGFADSEPLVVTDPVGTVRCKTDATGTPSVYLSIPDDRAGPLRLSHTVRLSMGTPLDGLHSVLRTRCRSRHPLAAMT